MAPVAVELPMINGNLSNGADLEAHEMSKLPLVLGIATALPERVVSTEELTEDFIEIMQADDRASELARKIGKTCGITTRYSCMQLEEFKNTPSMLTLGAASLNDRMALFEKHAVPLARAAGEKALSEWGRERSEITHVITFSTSGIVCPGLDLRLVKQLGLASAVKHIAVSYIGCHAGLVGLRTAAEICQGDPQHRVLVVTVEVNSVNANPVDPDNAVNNIIVNTIFGDGASAMILGAEARAGETPIYEVHRSSSSYIPDCDEDITARVSCQGLDVGLSRNVPKLVAGAVDPFVRELVGELDYEELLWAVHPGGKAIVDSTEKGCNLSPGKLQVSRDVLATFSNMASATVLFVLDQVRKDNAAKAGKHWTLALGFGPGITVEGSLLRLVNN